MKPWRGWQGCNCRPLSVIRACGTARRWTASFTDPARTTEPYKHYRIRCLILGLSPAMPTQYANQSSLPCCREFTADASYNYELNETAWRCAPVDNTGHSDSVLCLRCHLSFPFIVSSCIVSSIAEPFFLSFLEFSLFFYQSNHWFFFKSWLSGISFCYFLIFNLSKLQVKICIMQS